jgi:hypothetical protein
LIKGVERLRVESPGTPTKEQREKRPSRKMKEHPFLRFSMEALFELGIIDYIAQ